MNIFPVTLSVLVSISSILGYVSADDLFSRSPYSIVIDGGSTGSRLHIFEFVVDEFSGETDCVRRGSERSHKPLSAFSRDDRSVPLNQTALIEHIIYIFDFAARIIPPEYHLSTTIKFGGTAGMRLLDEDEQTEIYDSLYEGLIENSNFVFRNFERGDILTIGGDKEGFYGALATNFLKGIIDTTLTTTSRIYVEDGENVLGALDMGGSSTQIVYLPKRTTCKNDQCDKPSSANSAHLVEEDFFSISYLAYGVDRFRERLWDTWVDDQENMMRIDKAADSSKIIKNPCAFKGYEIDWKEYKLVGTGDAEKCEKQVQRLIPGYEPDQELGGRVGGVEHPPINGKFFAMSLYFFTFDSLRELSNPLMEAHQILNHAWPTPSIQELHDALDGFCSRSWNNDLINIQHEAHVFTRAEVLPHRCLESVYILTLLRDGFGFQPSSRDITFGFLVDGSEVEWSLGLALSQHAEQFSIDSEKEQPKMNHTNKGVCDDSKNEHSQRRS